MSTETPATRRHGTGYLHPGYAEALAEVGAPIELPHAGGWLLEREVPGTDLRDAMGCYPVFACREWTRLPADLREMADRLVTVVIVADPFGDFDPRHLASAFDVSRRFKAHYVVDLTRWTERNLPRRHKRGIAAAFRQATVEVCSTPAERLDEWVQLYGILADRHRIGGLRRFSRASFERQLSVPGLVMFRAIVEGQTVGLHLWYLQGDAAYGHLGATNERGYALSVSYALYRFAVDYFRPLVRWLDLGGGAGSTDTGGFDGLSVFKSGWSTGVRDVYLCGRILRPDAYRRLMASGELTNPYFPGYRAGEFSAAPAAATR